MQGFKILEANIYVCTSTLLHNGIVYVWVKLERVLILDLQRCIPQKTFPEET